MVAETLKWVTFNSCAKRKFIIVCCMYVPGDHSKQMTVGLWVLVGIFSFMLIEKVFPDDAPESADSVTQVRIRIQILLFQVKNHVCTVRTNMY